MERKRQFTLLPPQFTSVLGIAMISILYMAYYFYNNSRFNQKINYKSKLTLINPLVPPTYVAVICVTNGSPRTPALLRAWGNEFILRSPKSDFRFISYDPNPPDYIKERVVYFKPPARYVPSYRTVFYMNYMSAHDFLENSTAKWYMRTTYDCLMHVDRFFEYITGLEKKYNPEKDIVFKGKVLSINNRNLTYVHGGPGWLMSRAAVRKYIELEGEMKRRYEKANHGDDVNILNFPILMNMSLYDVDEPIFLGPPIKDEDYNRSVGSNWQEVGAVCRFPKEITQRPVPLSKVIFYHNGRKIDYAFTIGKAILDFAPPNIYVKSYHHFSEFCVKK